MENDVYIVNGLRTFIGSKGKIFKNIPAEDLASAVIAELESKNRKLNLKTNTVILGNATGGGGNMARLALLKAGLFDDTVGITIDMQCASGIESVITAYARIKSGLDSVTIAGGAESASTKCRRSYNENHPNFNASLESNEYESAQFIPEDFKEDSMTRGADETCRKFGIKKEELSHFAAESHKNAAAARKQGDIEKVTFPCMNASKDELIRDSMTESFASRLPPVISGGITNAATSCLFSDGAAFITLADSEILCGAEPDFFGTGYSFKIKSAADAGGNRHRSPESLVCAIERILEKSNMKESDIDRIDYNEAFAVVDEVYRRRFKNSSNAFGGALAYGHPYGASGAIVILHLLCAMEKFNERFAIAAVPAAGGVAGAVLIEREKIDDERK